jgi:hypothetical protein
MSPDYRRNIGAISTAVQGPKPALIHLRNDLVQRFRDLQHLSQNTTRDSIGLDVKAWLSRAGSYLNTSPLRIELTVVQDMGTPNSSSISRTRFVAGIEGFWIVRVSTTAPNSLEPLLGCPIRPDPGMILICRKWRIPFETRGFPLLGWQ